MRLRMNDRRERRFKYLQEATGENMKSGAIDVATDCYLAMAGGAGAYPNGALQELMQLACEQGSVTPKEIATILDREELQIEWERNWSVGN